MHLKEGEKAILLTTVAAVEARFASEKWAQVAKAMEDAGAEKYNASFLQQQFKIAMENAKDEDAANTIDDIDTANGAQAANGAYAPTATLTTKTEDETEAKVEDADA